MGNAVEVTPSVVLVHGLRTSSAIWTAQLEHLRAAGAVAVAVDLPGHGVRFDEPYTAQAAQRVVADAVAALPGPVLLVGLSLGGYTVLRFAAEHPGSVAGVVAAACTAEPRGRPVTLYRHLARAAVATGRAATRAGRATWERIGSGPTRPGPETPTGPGWEVVTAALEGIAGFSSLRAVGALRVPVWLVNGSRDPMRLDERRHLAANPRARLVVVPGAGHDVNADAPGAFDAVLTEALRATGARLEV